MVDLQFDCESVADGTFRRTVSIDRLIIAGWTGRDRDKMEAHMAELEALGIKRPEKAPVFYRASSARLTCDPQIESLAGESSGEAEVLVIQDGSQLLVGLASDHTDRGVEAYDITVSKQMCDKPCATTLWLFDEVAPHWDQLVLSSWIEDNGSRTLYQEGALSTMLSPVDLIDRNRAEGGSFGPGTAMLCGTPPAKGGVRKSTSFEMSLSDPILGRTITHSYTSREFPSYE
jgi:hypothetical protein